MYIAMKAVDFHSHILPGIDDGSRDTEMSIAMLRKMQQDGIQVVCATPHFYGSRHSLEHFLERREKSFNRLQEAMQTAGMSPTQDITKSDLASQGQPGGTTGITILPGAEVAFYSGLTRENDIQKLCIAGTNTLLLEMPFIPWTDFEINQVESLCFDHGLNVVIAHIERYEKIASRELMDRLLSLPVYIQINAETLLPMLSRRKWLEMFRNGTAQILGSDAHNLTSRPPRIGEAREMIRRKLGPGVLDRTDKCANELLKI